MEKDLDRLFYSYLRRPTRRRLGRLARAAYPLVWRTAFRATGNSEDALDISQDVFLALLLRPPAREDVRSPAGYLAWAAVGRATNAHRAAERRRARERTAAELAWKDGLAEDDREALRSEVSRLDETLRCAVELRYFAGFRNREIAAALGVSERVVEKRLATARARLRERLARCAPAAALSLDRDESLYVPSPPAGLLPDLLRLIRLGGALSIAARPVSSTAISAGSLIMAKKALVGAAVAAALAAALIVWIEAGRVGHAPARIVRPSETLVSQGEPEISAPLDDQQAATETAAKPAAPPRAVVVGIVRDRDELPVPGALLRLQGTLDEEAAASLRGEGYDDVRAGPLVLETASGEGGAFAFHDVIPAEYEIFAETESQVACWPPDVDLEPGETRARNVMLCRRVRLAARITGSRGERIPGAELLVDINWAWHCDGAERTGYWKRFPADAEGRADTGFCLGDRGPMPARIAAWAPGYAVEKRDVHAAALEGGEARVGFVLEPEYRATLLVTDPNGVPIENAAVEGVPLWDSKAYTGADGRVVLEHLQMRAYKLPVVKEGYFAGKALLAAGRDRDVLITCELAPLTPPVRGRIVFHEPLSPPERISSSEIWLEPYGPGVSRSRLAYVAPEKETLAYVFHPREPGTYRIALGQGPLDAASEPFYYDGARELEVDVHVRLEPPYVRGVVVERGTKRPLPEIEVLGLISWRGLSPWRSARNVNGFRFPKAPGNSVTTASDEAGRFLIDVPTFGGPGAFSLRLRAGSKERGWSDDLVLELENGSTREDVVLELMEPGSIEGIVAGGAGEPQFREVVAASDLEAIVEEAITDLDGRYRIDGLRPGSYLVLPVGRAGSIGSFGWHREVPELPDPGAIFDRPVVVEAGETTRWDLDLSRHALGRIEGTVPATFEGDLRAAAALMTGGRIGPRALSRSADVKNGSFALENIYPGRYLVWVETRPGGSRLSQAETEVGWARTARVALSVPEAALVLPVRGPAALDLAEVRVDEVHSVAAGSLAAGRVHEGTVWSGYRLSRLEGALRLEGLPAAMVEVCLLAPGFEEAWSEPVDLSAGTEMTARAIRLRRGRSIRVDLAPPAGQPPPGDVDFHVQEEGKERDSRFSVTGGGEDPWVLSGFPPGVYRISINPRSIYRSIRTVVTVEPERDAALAFDLVPADA